MPKDVDNNSYYCMETIKQPHSTNLISYPWTLSIVSLWNCLQRTTWKLSKNAILQLLLS